MDRCWTAGISAALIAASMITLLGSIAGIEVRRRSKSLVVTMLTRTSCASIEALLLGGCASTGTTVRVTMSKSLMTVHVDRPVSCTSHYCRLGHQQRWRDRLDIVSTAVDLNRLSPVQHHCGAHLPKMDEEKGGRRCATLAGKYNHFCYGTRPGRLVRLGFPGTGGDAKVLLLCHCY